MENMDKKECGGMCGGGCKDSCHGGSCGGMQPMGGCGCGGCGGKHHLKKMILMIVIVILIFWCGFKLGFLTGAVRAEYGKGMMNGNGYGMMYR